MPGTPALQPSARPPAFVTACVLGVIGAVLLLAGIITGSEPVLVFCALAGTASLGAGLVWRSQLIDAWRDEHGRGKPRIL